MKIFYLAWVIVRIVSSVKMPARPKGTRGSYRQAVPIPQIAGTTIASFQNFFFFFRVMDLPADEFIQWLMKGGPISEQMQCPVCACTWTLQRWSKNIDQVCWRCWTAKAHEISVRKCSFFERAHFTIQDIKKRAHFTIQDTMLFIKQYLDGFTLLATSRQVRISYQKSGLDWASFIRELFKEDLHRSLPHIRLSGEVEMDESIWPENQISSRSATGEEGLDIWYSGKRLQYTGDIPYGKQNKRNTNSNYSIARCYKFSGMVGVPIPLDFSGIPTFHCNP